MQVSLCGSLSVRDYTDSAGQRKWSTEVQVDEINFAESRAAYEARAGRDAGISSNMPPQSYGPKEPEGFAAIAQSIDEDDDLPF